MRRLFYTFFIFCLFSKFSKSQSFEGRLTYKVTYSGTAQILDSTYKFKELLKSSSGFYDSIIISIKDSNFSQKVNYKYGSKEEITLINEKIKFSINKQKLKVCDLSIASSLAKTSSTFSFELVVSSFIFLVSFVTCCFT